MPLRISGTGWRRPGAVAFLAIVLALAALAGPGAAIAGQPQEFPLEQAADPVPGQMALAENGDPKAQCDVGIAYLNGRHVAQDYRLGLHWLTKSSDSGFAYARFVLADVYNRGFAGVPVNVELAYYYASLAAASSTLPDKIRDRAAKLRDAGAKRLSTAQITGLQAKAAMAPLDAAVGN
ncbi:SEL1-like repeat protein [Desulfovibrio sp. DV]|uniref:SEL1-like repeat protein n=1 Tax=Desulfovibrio sp. DV TaxID=1844708 RepID=UPI00094BC54A|nr:SEL1-like repeat protein [Desulfovibrio sp. DV]